MTVAVASFVVIVPNIDFIFGLIPDSERFDPAKSVVILILWSRVIDYSFGSNGEILSNGPHFKWNLIAISGLVAGIIGLNLWLIPRYGLDCAGYSLVIAYVIFNMTKACYLWHKERIQPFGTTQLLLLFIGAVTFTMAYSASGEGLVALLMTNAIIATGLLVGFLTLRRKI